MHRTVPPLEDIHDLQPFICIVLNIRHAPPEQSSIVTDVGVPLQASLNWSIETLVDRQGERKPYSVNLRYLLGPPLLITTY